MKKGTLLWLIFAIFIVGINSCSKDEDPVVVPTPQTDSLTIYFTAFTNGDTLVYKKEFKDPLNRTMRIEKLIHYVSNIYLINENSSTLIKDVELIVYENNGTPDPGNSRQMIKVSVPIGNYTAIKFGLGLDPVMNSSDPNSFEPEHPLSSDQNMYWSTWLQYRFSIIDGRIDLDNDGILNDVFSIHPGFNETYFEKTFDKAISIEAGKENALSFTLEVNELFFGNDTVDLAKTPTWHGDTASINVPISLSNNWINSLILE